MSFLTFQEEKAEGNVVAAAARRKWRVTQEGGGSWEGQDRFRHVLSKLAHKQLDPGDWRRLAHHWAFTEEQIKAIEHQYSGESSKLSCDESTKTERICQ